MFGTGKIGLWSVIEEGIGITAGSMPALRPLLSLPIFGRSQAGNSGGSASAGYNKQSRSRREDVKMDTFQQLRDGDRDGDGDSQKHILKETQFTLTTNEGPATQGEWTRSQVLGWKGSKF
jgi:hypothetical protein